MPTPPDRWLTGPEAHDLQAAHGAATGADLPLSAFECRHAPLAEMPDAEQIRVARWARTAGGPLPETVAVYRLRPEYRAGVVGLAPRPGGRAAA